MLMRLPFGSLMKEAVAPPVVCWVIPREPFRNAVPPAVSRLSFRGPL
jgi:hypothetical protein